jgi:hypothetical protein
VNAHTNHHTKYTVLLVRNQGNMLDYHGKELDNFSAFMLRFEEML